MAMLNITLDVDPKHGDDLIANMLNTIMLTAAPYLRTGNRSDFRMKGTQFERRIAKRAYTNMKAGAREPWMTLMSLRHERI